MTGGSEYLADAERQVAEMYIGTHKHSSAAGEGDTPLSPEINSLLPRIDFSKIEYHNTYFWVSWE